MDERLELSASTLTGYHYHISESCVNTVIFLYLRDTGFTMLPCESPCYFADSISISIWMRAVRDIGIHLRSDIGIGYPNHP